MGVFVPEEAPSSQAQRNRSLGRQHRFTKLEIHPWFLSPSFFLAVILSIVFLATEKRQGWGLGQKDSRSGKRSRNHYPLTEIINTNMSPEGSYNDWESNKLVFVKCKRQVGCSMPPFSYLEWSFLCIAAFLISETALWFCAIKIYFQAKCATVHSQFHMHLSQYVIISKDSFFFFFFLIIEKS